MNRTIVGGVDITYMLPPKEQVHITENYVSSPPALIVVDETNTVFTLGFVECQGPRGEFGYPVLINGMPSGEVASRIERRNNKIRIFTNVGFKTWNGKSFF